MEKIKKNVLLSITESEQINSYVNFLLDYNNKINLIGKATEQEVWDRHILDCLQLANLIKDKNIEVADLGSGAGLPGILLSIVGIKKIHLFEKSFRKCEFLEKAKIFSSNPIVVHNDNILNYKGSSFDLIVSRALGNLNLLLELSSNLKNPNTTLLFLKGKKIYEEIEVAKKNWHLEYKLIDSITSPEGKIIEITSFEKI